MSTAAASATSVAVVAASALSARIDAAIDAVGAPEIVRDFGGSIARPVAYAEQVRDRMIGFHGWGQPTV